VLVLPEHLASSLALGHPWVYRTHVPPGVAYASGTWLEVRAGSFRGHALWDASSPIALRMFSRATRPDAAFFRGRVREALALRASLRERGTNAFRLIFGEADGLPGLTVDVYDRYAVVVTYAESLDAVVPFVVRALSEELALDGILRRRSRGEAAATVQVLFGTQPPDDLIVSEHGVRFYADLAHGQKTGLFLDHRDNRAFVRSEARGRRVLNLFAYTGAFSVYAALGGASRVTSVDIAAPAIAAARDNFALNQLDPEAHEFVVADVFDYLEAARTSERRFELVISDPPSFASSKEQKYGAVRAYTRLHTLGLRVVAPGGLYAAASCTAQVSPEAFQRLVAEAAERARVRFQIVHDAGQPLDHPVLASHPDGRYLKFVVGRVLDRA
jgi:23S rRNA (cytosine1962-C5)-methyltransferase